MEKDYIKELEAKYQSAKTVDDSLKITRQYYAFLEDCLKKNPNDIQSLIYLGKLSWEPFHYDEKARHYLTKAIQLDPKNTEARFWLAKSYYHDCNYEPARTTLLEAIAIDSTRADCLHLLASIEWDFHRYLNAIEYMKKAVQYAPDWPAPHHFLATLCLEINDVASAEMYANKGVALSRIPPICPRNDIEEYYETVVTGRARKNLQERFQSLIERIQKAKAASART